jgi:hypothetical protein
MSNECGGTNISLRPVLRDSRGKEKVIDFKYGSDRKEIIVLKELVPA